MNKSSILLVAFLFIFSCVSTRITSFTDPEYRSFRIDRLVVVMDTEDLDYKMKMEPLVASKFLEKGVTAYPGYEILPPTRNYSTNDLKDAFLKNNLNSVFIFKISDIGYTQEEMTIYQPYTSQGTITRMGSNQYQYSMQTKGGPETHTIKKPRLSIKSYLFDAKNGNKIWVSTSFSGGNAFTNINDTLKDYAIEIVRRLEIDNHVQRANPYSEKSPGAIDSRETIKKVNMARIEDIPAQVRNQALKEMSRTELEAVINDMPKDVANKLTIENIRAIHNYNKR